MTDIVERARNLALYGVLPAVPTIRALRDAADEIEQLRAQLRLFHQKEPAQ